MELQRRRAYRADPAFREVGITALRLSLPYHDVRMPPELARADFIVSSNIVRTLQACRQAVLDARRALWWLRDQGYERLGMVGTSLGSCLAMLTSTHEPLVRDAGAQSCRHSSPMSYGAASQPRMCGGVSTSTSISTSCGNFGGQSAHGRTSSAAAASGRCSYAQCDLTFPVDLSVKLVDEFARRTIPTEVAVLPCGHYSTGKAPFKFLDGYYLARFLRRNL